MRRLMSVLVAVLVAASFTGPTAVAAPAVASAPATGKTPVVFVHGFSGGSSILFKEMIDKFKAAGWGDRELVRWDYDWKQSNFTTADQLKAKVAQVLRDTGAAKVDIVAHSMGSLSTRYYVKALGGTAKTKRWLSIGGVNQGADVARLCPGFLFDSCADMKPGSRMLKALNDSSPAPAPTKYQTLSSSCDLMAPESKVKIPGVPNVDVGCYEHIYMPKGDRVITEAVKYLRG
ncbi:lipase [Allokutzneria sp. A3M-2-11 16]|uniref:esterase/lipase family protein n=1 Tax=Allokutzneria sp. A3M-2-11 16 TaxID=2962043 RepID=UPI0020B74A85|nr:lipase [Allokutzneria sp. A3M-2-11 16]MCP3797882.1 lipase [Allokutzneria sp. A3M-2-11 16]